MIERREHLSGLSKTARSKDRKREQLWDKQEGKCFYCQAPIRTRTRGFKSMPFASLDHRMPASLGGTYSLHNLVAACGDCNSKKGSKVPKELWLQYEIRARGMIDEIKGSKSERNRSPK